MSGPAIATIATGVAIVAVPAIVAGPILGALGFGAAGVAAGQHHLEPMCMSIPD